MHSRKTKQASDILLKENDTVINNKQQIADIFSDDFVHIANGAPEIDVHDFGEDFTEHPNVIAIQDNNRERSLTNCFNFQYTNKTQIERLLSSMSTRKACGHDSLPLSLIKESDFCKKEMFKLL